jgi:hypothetical protein
LFCGPQTFDHAAACGKVDPLTLTTHAIVGAGIAGLVPAHPLFGVSLAFASHFLLDALPHWDFPIRSSSIDPKIGARMKYYRALFADMLTIGGDAVLGIVLAIVVFTTETQTNFLVVFAGACAGILPDPLKFAYTRFPHQPLTSIQRFHEWIHTSRRMLGRPVLGIASQFALIIVFVRVTRPLLPP